MENTHFAGFYFEEIADSYTNTMNLVYVAFTRAKSALLINCEKPKSGENSNSNKSRNIRIQNLIQEALEKIDSNPSFNKCWNAELMEFELGSVPEVSGSEKAAEVEKIVTYQFTDFHERLRIRSTDDEFLLPTEKSKAAKNRGKIIHRILSLISSIDDLDKACQKVYYNGEITLEEMNEIRNELMKMLGLFEVFVWFNGEFKILNERNIFINTK